MIRYFLFNQLIKKDKEPVLLKQTLSNLNKIELVLDIIVADLGVLYSRLDSPKLSPGYYYFKWYSNNNLVNI